ncbi:MAG TPA: DUF4157 domain-containing protein [Puia sp.]|nr:DUF4157 domain-containing protein [Puia sp.]
MSYNLRNYRHRNPKGGEEKPTSTPFFGGAQKGTVRRKKKGTFFQPKLAVGQPGDSHEKEADSAARQVTQSAEGPGVQQKELPGVQRLATSKEDEKLGTNDARMEKDKEEPMKPMQKKEAPDKKQGEGEEKKKKPGGKQAGGTKKETGKKKGPEPKKEKKPVQKAEDKKKKEKPVQKKEKHGSTTTDAVAEEIRQQSGKGSPLPPKILAEMSKSFSVDFSNVRIHQDAAAAKLCQELNAIAFTHGQDIFFNEGRFNPESKEGKMLLAHELTHVIQQANRTEL